MRENFEKITRQVLKKEDAPIEITLPKELACGMAESWLKSFPKGKSQEQGGILVRKKDGSYKWKAGQPGSSGAFTPNHGDVDKDETLIVVGHTHPYDKSEESYTNMSFSGVDLAVMVVEKHPLEIVRSGEALFVVARTEEFNKKVMGLDASGKKKMLHEIYQNHLALFNTHKGELPERVHATAKAICEKYDLLYYKGKGDEVSKVRDGL